MPEVKWCFELRDGGSQHRTEETVARLPLPSAVSWKGMWNDGHVPFAFCRAAGPRLCDWLNGVEMAAGPRCPAIDVTLGPGMSRARQTVRAPKRTGLWHSGLYAIQRASIVLCLSLLPELLVGGMLAVGRARL